jgi:LmbE family N-acetylglucosaminyl deacetylase
MFLSKQYNKFLIIASHPDDEIIGCGGTLVKLAKLKKNIQIVFLSDCAAARFKKDSTQYNKHLSTRKNSASKVCEFLKIKPPIFYDFPNISYGANDFYEISTKLFNLINKNKYDLVFTHSYSDNNRDHRMAFEAALSACRPVNKFNSTSLITFETNSATDYSASQFKQKFNPNFFVDITNEIDKKLILLKLYKYELRKFPHSRSVENIKNLAKVRGSSVYTNFAEAFEIIRLKND